MGGCLERNRVKNHVFHAEECINNLQHTQRNSLSGGIVLSALLALSEWSKIVILQITMVKRGGMD